jgi:hypothetical protein
MIEECVIVRRADCMSVLNEYKCMHVPDSTITKIVHRHIARKKIITGLIAVLLQRVSWCNFPKITFEFIKK